MHFPGAKQCTVIISYCCRVHSVTSPKLQTVSIIVLLVCSQPVFCLIHIAVTMRVTYHTTKLLLFQDIHHNDHINESLSAGNLEVKRKTQNHAAFYSWSLHSEHACSDWKGIAYICLKKQQLVHQEPPRLQHKRRALQISSRTIYRPELELYSSKRSQLTEVLHWSKALSGPSFRSALGWKSQSRFSSFSILYTAHQHHFESQFKYFITFVNSSIKLREAKGKAIQPSLIPERISTPNRTAFNIFASQNLITAVKLHLF